MLSPRQSSTRERTSLDGLWRFALDPDGRRPGRALVDERAAGRPGDARAGQLQRRRPDARGAPSRRRRLVPAHGARPARLGRAADRPALRRRHASGDGVGRRDAGRRARGRLHAVRGRRHRARSRGRGGARDGRGQQRAVVDVDPAGLRAGARRRPSRAAVLPRLLQLRGPAPVGVAAHDASRARRRRHGQHDRDRRHDRHRRLPGRRRGRRRSRRAGDGARCRWRRGRSRRRQRGHAAHRGAQRSGAPAPATCTRSTVEVLGAGRRARRRLPAAVRRAHRRRGRAPLPDQRRAVSLHRVRQARGLRRPRPRPRPRGHGPRLRAARVGRRELVPDVALSLRRGGARLRRPARRRGHRRDGRRGAQPRHRHAHPRRGRGADHVQRRDDQRSHAGDPPPGDPRARRARQEPPVRGDLEHRQRARHRRARGAGVLRAARRRDAPPGPDAAGRVRELHEGHARARRGLRPLRRAAAQPLLRLVRATRATSSRPSGRSRPSCASGRGEASRSS